MKPLVKMTKVAIVGKNYNFMQQIVFKMSYISDTYYV